MTTGDESLKERLRRSEALWAESVRKRHELIAADYGSAENMPLFPCRVGPPGEEAVPYLTHPYTIWDLTPASFAAPFEMERVGRLGDGGKWVCGLSRYEARAAAHPDQSPAPPVVVYSLGVGRESSWEAALLARVPTCEVYGYDPSVAGWAPQLGPGEAGRARAHFSRAGVAGRTDTEGDGPGFHTIQDLMRINGHEYIDILKMDIEQAEFPAMTSLLEAFPDELPVGQLLVEIHLARPSHLYQHGPDTDMKTSKFYLDWFEKLEAAGLRPVWTEPNLLAVTLGQGRWENDPICAEYTFVNARDSRGILTGGSRWWESEDSQEQSKGTR